VKPLGTGGIAWRVAKKDLRIEWRGRVVINQVLPFAGLVMVAFAFALDNDAVLQRTAGGLVWLATMFSTFLVVQRSYAADVDDGALESLRAAGVDMQGVFLGKSLAVMVELFLLQIVLILVGFVLYDVQLSLAGWGLLFVTMVGATLGLGFVGVLYGGLIAGAGYRETLLPLLVLPVVAPVLLAATRATESAIGVASLEIMDGWPWVGILFVFAGIFGLGGLLSFDSVVGE